MSGQKLVGIACVKTEVDIIEAFVRHTLAFVDHLVILDNGSVDGTVTVLRSLERQLGFRLVVVEDSAPTRTQAILMTFLMKKYAIGELGADWVVCLDADEFIAGIDPVGLRDLLSSHQGVLTWTWKAYAPQESDPKGETNPVKRIQHCVVGEMSPWDKVLVHRSIAQRANTIVEMGSHWVTVGQVKEPSARIPSGFLAHFPIRNPYQWASKVTNHVLKHLANPDYIPGHGLQHFEHWEALKTDLDASLEHWRDQAMYYGVPPEVNRTKAILEKEPLKYLGGAQTEPAQEQNREVLIAVLMSKAEALARSLSEAGRTERVLREKIETLQVNISKAHEVETELMKRLHVLESSRAVRWARRLRRVLRCFQGSWWHREKM
jgi:hypothetical protein